jgi:hypothetical protein
MPSAADYTASELLAVMSSRLLKDGQIVLVVGEKSYTVLGQFIR